MHRKASAKQALADQLAAKEGGTDAAPNGTSAATKSFAPVTDPSQGLGSSTRNRAADPLLEAITRVINH